MPLRLTLVSIKDLSSKSLIARRIAQNPKVTMNKAMLLLDHLPSVIFSSIDNRKAEVMAEALNTLGCQIKLDPVFPGDSPQEPPVSREPEERPRASYVERKRTLKTPLIFQPLKKRKEKVVEKQAGHKRIKKEWLFLGAILLVVGFMFTVRKFFVFTPPAKSQSGSRLRKMKSAVRDTEKDLAKKPDDPELRERAVDAYKKMAQNETDPSQRIEHLSKAIRLRSDDSHARAMLSKAYTDEARRTLEGDAAIRFYRMAISFNQYNEAAWYGLIQAYEKNKQFDKADEARRKKEKIFAQRYQKVTEFIKAYGRITEFPVAKDEVLFFGYRSRKANRQEVLAEVFDITKKLSRIEKQRFAEISVYTTGRSGLLISSPIKELPSTFDVWKKRIFVETF